MIRSAACWASLSALMTAMFVVNAAAAQEGPLQEALHLQKQAQSLFNSAQYKDGIDVAKRAIALREKTLGREHPDVATSLWTLGNLYEGAGNYALAQATHQRALSLREKLFGVEHRDTARSLTCLADAYLAAGDHTKAAPLYQRALAVFEKVVGPDHFDTSTALTGLGQSYVAAAAYERAEPFYKRVLAIRERTSGAESTSVAAALNILGSMYSHMGSYARALPVYTRALAIREKVDGREHPETVVVLANLAVLHSYLGHYTEAEAMLKRALATQQRTLGIDHPNTGHIMSSLAVLYLDTGAFRQAEDLMLETIALQRKTQSKNLWSSLGNLGVIYLETGRERQAESVFAEALERAEAAYGKEHPFALDIVNHLGRLYRVMGNYPKAQLLHQRSVELARVGLGPKSWNTAMAMVGLADLHSETGEYAKALALYRQAIAIYEGSLGPEHRSTIQAMRSLAMLHWARGESQQALSLLQRVQRVETLDSERFLSSGSEARKQDYVRSLTRHTFEDVSFAASMPGVAGATLGLTRVLQHKGRVLDAVSDSIARLRRSLAPEDRALLERLADVAGQLSALTYGQSGLSPEQYQARLALLSRQQEQLGAQLAKRSQAFRRESTPVSLANIKQAIPANAVLVEWFRYTPFDPKGKGQEQRYRSPRYMAYVLKRQGDPIAVDVGEARALETSARRLRAALANPASKDVKQHAVALSDKLLKPIYAHLRGVEHIVFSPDGELNLVPMAVLLDESGTYLTEGFNVSYLTSGRDLLRIGTGSQLRNNAVVMANPDYGKRNGVSPQESLSLEPQRSGELDRSGLVFRPLVATALEAQSIRDLLQLDAAGLLLNREATESRLKRLKSPRILHIASHGFFLSDQELVDVLRRRSGTGAAQFKPSENPLLRSGIALAGANQRSSAGEDGILTALEATQLDLSGTELVVLSACDSGVGQVQNGEGVYGLRRALALAGAQTQVTSLWKVSDDATRYLMVDYYKRLLQGEGRAAALRRTQRAMIASSKYSHPYYWASFIPIGNWRSLPNVAALQTPAH